MRERATEGIATGLAEARRGALLGGEGGERDEGSGRCMRGTRGEGERGGIRVAVYSNKGALERGCY